MSRIRYRIPDKLVAAISEEVEEWNRSEVEDEETELDKEDLDQQRHRRGGRRQTQDVRMKSTRERAK